MSLVKYNNNSISAVSSLASMPSGALVPIKTLTASSSSSLSFIHGSNGVTLDSTYPIYVFHFINIHPSTLANFEFNATTDGSNFNVVKTTSAFYAEHEEDGGSGQIGYSGIDEAQATGFQQLTSGSYPSTDNDASIVGILNVFAPSDTTHVKHFVSKTTFYGENNTDRSTNSGYVGGYFNTTSALTGFQFKMGSGNLDSGKIKLYGIKDS